MARPLHNPWVRIDYVPPPGTFKCTHCGKRLPVERMQPGRPALVEACRPCHAASVRADNPYKRIDGATIVDFSNLGETGVPNHVEDGRNGAGDTEPTGGILDANG